MTDTATTLVTAGRKPGLTNGAVNPPVFRASTFLFDTVKEFEAASRRPFDGPFYGRLGTPTTFAFEEAVAAAEGGYRSIATASGLAALSSTFLAFLTQGDHALVVDSVYGPMRRFCDGMLRRMGVETTYYDPAIGAAIAKLIRPNTHLIHLEAPGSGTFDMQDIPAIAAAARQAGVVTSIDNTWATPLFFSPLEHGIDVSIHSASKYIVGHSDAMLGVITTTEGTFQPIRHAVRDIGCCAGSEECNLGLRGLRTLDLRMRHHQEAGMALATWLNGRPEVARVLYPALADDPGHGLWRRDFTGASSLFSIELKPVSETAVNAFVDSLDLFKLGFSWGGYESLVLPVHPPPSRSASASGDSGPMLRFHVGHESLADLTSDLEAGFSSLARHTRPGQVGAAQADGS